MKKMKVGIIFGGQSGEHEVSLMSSTSVIKVMDKTKYDIIPIGITKEGKITSVTIVKKVEQTAAYAAEVNSDYLDKTYPGEKAEEDIEVAPVSGATLTSKAVMFAVQAASNYAKNQLGFGK